MPKVGVFIPMSKSECGRECEQKRMNKIEANALTGIKRDDCMEIIYSYVFNGIMV